MSRHNKIAILFLFLSNLLVAQKTDPSNLLIRNVRVITNSSDTSNVLVNLLIKDNILEIVTTDQLEKPEQIGSLDANGGYLVGNLKLNEAPRFVILNKDPRQQFNVWLDLDSYMIFAIDDGVIHRNRLFKDEADKLIKKDPNLKVKWFAYTPPPFALPVNYGDASKWNYWDTKNFSGVFTGALALDRLYWLYQNQESEEQIGELETNAGGEIRGLRFGAIGKLKFFKRPWSYTVFFATHAFEKGFEQTDINSVSLFDLRFDIPLSDHLVLSIGKQKEPISLERVPSSLFNQMQERVSDAFLPSRNTGVQLAGNLWGEKISWVGGIFNQWLDNDGGLSDNETVLMGRVTGVAFEDERRILHIGLSNRYSNGKNDVNYGVRPEFNKSIRFIKTDLIETDHMNLVSMELSFLQGPFWLFSEYVHNDITSTNEGTLNFSSFHITGSWVLTGENRTYRYRNGTINPIPIANGVNQGGWGAWELSARISNYDLNDKSINAGVMTIYSLGLNWWLSSAAMLSINGRHINTNILDSKGNTFGLNTRILLILD